MLSDSLRTSKRRSVTRARCQRWMSVASPCGARGSAPATSCRSPPWMRRSRRGSRSCRSWVSIRGTGDGVVLGGQDEQRDLHAPSDCDWPCVRAAARTTTSRPSRHHDRRSASPEAISPPTWGRCSSRWSPRSWHFSANTSRSICPHRAETSRSSGQPRWLRPTTTASSRHAGDRGAHLGSRTSSVSQSERSWLCSAALLERPARSQRASCFPAGSLTRRAGSCSSG